MPDFADDELQVVKRKRGRQPDTPGGGNYNCATVPTRVPKHLKHKIKDIIALYDRLEALKDDWEERIETAAKSSKNGQPSPRYDKALQLLKELDELL